MIKLVNVTKEYGKFKAVDKISFEIKKGEIVGFLGPNGAGKTTTMRVITGYFLPTSGEVYISNYNIEEEPDVAKSLIGYLPENPPLYPEMPVNDYLKFVGLIKGLSKNVINNRIDYVIEKTALQEKRFEKIKTLSKGLKQRVGIAAAIIHDPEVLILDEPTIGLDPLQIIEIRNLIKEIGKEKTILLSSHILAEVQEVCDKVIIIHKGKILAQDSKDNLKKKITSGLRILIKVKNPDENIIQILKGVVGVKEVILNENKEILVFTEDIENIQNDLSKKILENGYTLLEIKEEEMSLEEIFSKIIKEE
ncbi:MAG: ABC transporter ATP-binding protein [Spirochaetes bacterium]|nr:ABC transporter ATP-binding protein [Spirochaetota bacterium]